MPTRAPRRRWFTSPLGLVAAIVLIMAVALLSLAGAGLVGAGPFGHLGAISTPLATAPRQAAPTATPSEHIELNTPLTRPLTDWENDSDCAFASDGYHVTAPPHYTTYCVTPAAYDNFHLKARVHVPTGATRADYALFFRVKDNNNFDYISLSFKVFPSLPPTQVAGPSAATPTPNYDIQASWDASSHSNGNDAILGDGLTPAAHVTGDGDNLLEVYANGPTVTILVNGQQLGSFQDANNKVGKIGLGAEAGVAIYTSISVATLAT